MGKCFYSFLRARSKLGGMKRYLRGQCITFIMADETTDALKEANQIALELGDKKKSTDSTTNQNKTAVVSVQTKSDSSKTVSQVVTKKPVVEKKKKAVKKVEVKKKVSSTNKSKPKTQVVAYSKTTLVDIAAQSPPEEVPVQTMETKRVYEDNSVELKNPLSEDNSKGGLIETLGGLAMVLIVIEVVIIVLLIISTFFK